MNEDINRMDIREFREVGFLQEVNRQFFHPLGLALEVIIDEDGPERLGGIWDYRDDPEGMLFAAEDIDADKASFVESLRQQKASTRYNLLGAVIQPILGQPIRQDVTYLRLLAREFDEATRTGGIIQMTDEFARDIADSLRHIANELTGKVPDEN